MRKRNANFLYALMNLFLWGTIGALVTYASRFYLHLGLSNTVSGVLLAAVIGSSILLQPVLTAVVERLHVSVQRIICTAAAMILACCLPLLALADTKSAAVPLMCLACLCVQTQPAFVNALGVCAMHNGLHINYGLCRGIGSVSFALCVRAVNALITHLGMRAVSVSAAVLALGLLITALLFPKLENLEKKQRSASRFSEFFRNNKRFFLLLLASALLLLSHNTLTNFMYQIALFKGDGDAQGTAVMLSALVELPTMFLFTRMRRIARCELWLKLSGLFFVLRVTLSLVLPGVTGLYIAQLTQAMGFALYTVSSVAYTEKLIAKRDEVKGQTYLAAANSAGSLAASLLAGTLIDLLGVKNMLLVSIAVAAAGALLLCAAVTPLSEDACGAAL